MGEAAGVEPRLDSNVIIGIYTCACNASIVLITQGFLFVCECVAGLNVGSLVIRCEELNLDARRCHIEAVYG